MNLTFNTSTFNDIKIHFNLCDRTLICNIENHINLNEYIRKIISNAERIEIWDNNILIGFLAVYIQAKEAYITNISVTTNHKRKGIASTIWEALVKTYKNQINTVRLEVEVNNYAAICFYDKLGFNKKMYNDKHKTLLMEINIKSLL